MSLQVFKISRLYLYVVLNFWYKVIADYTISIIDARQYFRVCCMFSNVVEYLVLSDAHVIQYKNNINMHARKKNSGETVGIISRLLKNKILPICI